MSQHFEDEHAANCRCASCQEKDDLYAEAVRVISASLPRSTPAGYPKRAATALERAGLLNRRSQ